MFGVKTGNTDWFIGGYGWYYSVKQTDTGNHQSTHKTMHILMILSAACEFYEAQRSLGHILLHFREHARCVFVTRVCTVRSELWKVPAKLFPPQFWLLCSSWINASFFSAVNPTTPAVFGSRYTLHILVYTVEHSSAEACILFRVTKREKSRSKVHSGWKLLCLDFPTARWGAVEHWFPSTELEPIWESLIVTIFFSYI